MKIWAMFSVENEYNQPENNLVKLYLNKPTFEQILKTFGITDLNRACEVCPDLYENILAILDGEDIRLFSPFGESYRIEEVEVETK